MRRRIGEFASRRTDLDWICAENAVYSVVEGRRPNAADLDGLTDRPIFVTTYDQHSVWLNAAALTVLGIADGADVAWGRPERDPSHRRADRLGDRFLHQCNDRGRPRATAARHPDVLAATALPQAVRQHAHGHRAGHHHRGGAAGAARRTTAVRARTGRGGAHLAGDRGAVPPGRRGRRVSTPASRRGRRHAAESDCCGSARSSSTPTTSSSHTRR